MNGISGIGSGMGLMQNIYGMRKPDSDELAQQLFSKLDTSGQGYIEKSDLQSAFSNVSETSETSNLSTDESDLDELFSQLDSDNDGKITEQELSDSLAQIDEQINDLFSQMRMNETQGQMMPPPPPPPPPEGEAEMDDIGFTEEELTAQLEEIGDSDSTRSTLIENILADFEAADTDGDGRVNLEEAMAFDQTNSDSSNEPGIASGVTSSDTETLNEKVMMQMMRLVQAYSLGGQAENETSSTLNIST
ncbi:MAG: EF-hand domain-containing protein [Chromatiales bacterium]|jgi:Ca2+-binding EF-hand superfamily protein